MQSVYIALIQNKGITGKSRLFPVELYRRLISAFNKTNLVYLQGWGEPFTNPHFMEFLHIEKKAGCMVGTTTNGMLLNPAKGDNFYYFREKRIRLEKLVFGNISEETLNTV